jgi:hypothetical protein
VCAPTHTVAHARTPRTLQNRFSGLFFVCGGGGRLAQGAAVIWFLERESEMIVCEIRRAPDDERKFEFEIADSEGPTTHRFDTATDLIRKYLYEQSKLFANGWRPRSVSSIE